MRALIALSDDADPVWALAIPPDSQLTDVKHHAIYSHINVDGLLDHRIPAVLSLFDVDQSVGGRHRDRRLIKGKAAFEVPGNLALPFVPHGYGVIGEVEGQVTGVITVVSIGDLHVDRVHLAEEWPGELDLIPLIVLGQHLQLSRYCGVSHQLRSVGIAIADLW